MVFKMGHRVYPVHFSHLAMGCEHFFYLFFFFWSMNIIYITGHLFDKKELLLVVYFKCFLFLLFLKFILFIFWLRWVFVAAHRLSLVAASGGYSSLWCAGFSLRWLLFLRSISSRHVGFSSCGTQAQ